jgi:hypothetical protein
MAYFTGRHRRGRHNQRAGVNTLVAKSGPKLITDRLPLPKVATWFRQIAAPSCELRVPPPSRSFPTSTPTRKYAPARLELSSNLSDRERRNLRVIERPAERHTDERQTFHRFAKHSQAAHTREVGTLHRDIGKRLAKHVLAGCRELRY